MNKKIEISLNGSYLCTTAQSRTCKEAIARIRELAAEDGLVIGGRGQFEVVKKTDKLSASFVK
jgi:hypothetical protein